VRCVAAACQWLLSILVDVVVCRAAAQAGSHAHSMPAPRSVASAAATPARIHNRLLCAAPRAAASAAGCERRERAHPPRRHVQRTLLQESRSRRCQWGTGSDPTQITPPSTPRRAAHDHVCVAQRSPSCAHRTLGISGFSVASVALRSGRGWCGAVLIALRMFERYWMLCF
jgi:hypothetical protein